MSCSEAKHGNLRRPKSNPISHSDPNPKKTHSIFRFSTNNDCSDKSNKSFNKKPNKKIKKLFTSVTLGGLGCGGRSEPESAPAVTQSAAEWEAKKLKMMKKKNKKKKKKQMKMASNVCCAPPRIGFAYDVAPTARVDVQIRNHRERSCGAPRRTANAAHVSDDRQFRRFRRSSRGGLPEIMMFQRNLLMFERSLSRNDQFGDWRLNVDTMSYEELLDLSDRIGYVGTGLQEDEIMLCLVKTTSLNSESLPLLTSSGKDWTCSICQGGCKEDEELGRLDCGHYHHINCIKRWLQYKNACPICKTAAVVDKLG